MTIAYAVPGTSPVSVNVRVKEWTGSEYLYSSWETFSFTLQEDPDAPYRVSQLVLANDTGASASDRSTSDSQLSGQIAGGGSLEGVSIEFDHDGDGLADGSATTDAAGVFVYTTADLADGRNTIRARAVHAGSGLLGDWTSVSFVLSDDPDGAEAQAQAAALDGYESAMQAAQTTYDDSLATANGAYDTAIDSAATTYQGATAQAQSDQAATNSAAAAALASTVAAADAAYTTAMETAAAAYAAAMASYSDDPTSFEEYEMVDGFAWPDAPDTSGAPEPAASGPSMPADIAGYSDYGGEADGPEFDAYSDPNYQSTVSSELSAYLAAVGAARAQYDADKAAAENAYGAACSAAGATKTSSDAAAQALYESTISGYANPIDLAQAQQDYSDALAQAQTDYENTLASLSAIHEAAMLAAESAHQSRVAAAEAVHEQTMQSITETYDNAMGAAMGAYFAAVEAYEEEEQRIDEWVAEASMAYDLDPEHADPPPTADIDAARAANAAAMAAAEATFNAECEAAWIVYRDAAADADYALAMEVANSEKTLSEDCAAVQETRDAGEASALTTKIAAEQSAWLVKRNAEISYSANGQDIEAQAIQVREDAIATATKVNECEVALARKAKDVAMAAAEKARTLAMQQANADYAIALANARKAAVAVWAAAEGTHWATYQEALVNNAADYDICVANAALTFATAEAAATETRTVADAEAWRVYTDSAAAARLVHTLAKNLAVKQFKVGGGSGSVGYIAAAKTYKLDVAADRKDQTETYETAEATYMATVAPLRHSLSVALAGARHTYACAEAAAERDRSKKVIDQAGYDSAIAAAASVLGFAQYNAYATYYGTGGGGVYGASATKASTRVGANKDFRDDLTTAELTLQNARSIIADSAEKAMAQAEADRMLAYDTAEVARDNSNMATTLAYVTTVSAAGAAQTGTTAWVGAAADQSDIQAWATYVIALATDYCTAVSAWASSAGTPWATYQAELAAASLAGITARANADVADVTRTTNADAAWIESLADAEAALVTGELAGQVAQGTSISNARIAKATDDANAQRLLMEGISTAITTYDDGVAGYNKTLKDVESAQKQAVENAADAAWWMKKAADLAVTLNPLLSVADRIDSSAAGAILQASEAAMKSYRASVETTAAQALADARRDWTTGGVAAMKEQLVQDLGAATRTAVDSMAGAEQTFVDAIALAEKTFVYDLAATHSTYELDRSAVQQTAEHAWADSAELAAQDYAAADAAEEVARAQAKKNYDIARANLYASTVSAWAAAEGTHYADYIDALATADAAWTATVAPARVAYVTATTTADVTWSNELAAADKAWAHCQADAEHARVMAMEPAGKLAQEQTADADETQTNAVSLANMTFRKALIAADEIYNNAVAAAERLFAENNAGAGHDYVDGAVPHKVNQFLNDLSDEDYSAAIASVLQTYTGTLHANNNTRQTSIADALVVWTSDVAAAEKTLNIASATAARDFAVGVQAATDTFAGSKKTACDAETGALASGKSARTTAVATAYANWTTAATAADTTFVAAAGAADVTWNTDMGTAEGDYHVAVANDAAAAAQAWATAAGTAEAHFHADMVSAHAAWLADVAPDYVTYRTATASAESDYDADVAAADGALAVAEEAAMLAYCTTLAPAYATRTTTIGAADTELEKSIVIQGDAHTVAVANANLTSVTTTAGAQETHANAMATAKRDYDVAMLTNTGSSQALQDARDQAEANSTLAVKTAEADARLAWTISVSTADEVYSTGVATGVHAHAVAVATAKKSYADTYSGARSTWYQATVAADVTHAKAVADAEYDLTVASAQAFSDAQVAQYQARATAMLAFVSYNLPWVDFEISLASHEAAWASSIAPSYVAYETALAGAEKTYVYVEADACSVCETAIDNAVATFDTTMNGAWLTSSTAEADAQMACVTAEAPLQKAYDQAKAQANRDYQVAVATAARDLACGTVDQAQHDSNVAVAATDQSADLEAAMDTYRTGAAGAEQTRLISLADASETYAVAHADASLLYTTTAAGSIETYVITVSDAEVACETAIADESCDYWILATDSYADEMALLSAGSPWGQQYYAAARAEADRVAIVAPAERDRQIASAEAARDYAQDEAAAEKDKALDEAQADRDQAVAAASAEHARAVAEADALAADGEYSPKRLVTPNAGGARIVSSGMALNGEPTNFAVDCGFDDLFNSAADGWMGDGYYMGIVSSMFYVAPACDELGYTNPFHRFLGENLIRPVVGDEALINATDTQIILGTVAICAAPFLIAAAPAAIMAAPGLFTLAVLSGAGIGAAYNAAGQLEAGASWSEIDWWSVGTSAVVGGVIGAASFVALPYLATAIPGFCTVATVAGFGMGCYSVYNGINNIQDGKYYTGTLDLVLGLTGIYGATRGWFSRASRAMGGGCFVLGTQVVRHAVAAQLASRSYTTEEAASGWDPKLLALAAGTLLAGLFVAPEAAERRRREEARRARRLMFEQTEGNDPWQDDWREVAEDSAAPDTCPADRWDGEIDRLCDALFNGPNEDAVVDAEFDAVPEKCLYPAHKPDLTHTFDPVSGGSSPALTLVDRPCKAIQNRVCETRSMPTPSTQCQRRSKLKQGRSRRWLRGVCAAACLLLSGLFLLKASPPDLAWPGDPAVSLAGAATSDLQPKYVTSNIEDIRVGDRVLGRNPQLTDAERTIRDPDPATWRRLELRAPKVDGSWADVVLLRSLSWLREQQAEVGGQVWISVPECGIDGHATVLAIGPCPPIPPGPGRVVTGTYRHASAQVLDLHVDGLAEPIGTTANHPFWSEDRQQFLRADQLQPGERLRTLHGTARLVAAVPRAATEPVYNLEVQTEHVYHVTDAGVLVHNGGICPYRDPQRPKYPNGRTHIDHKRARSLGGPDTPDNKWPLAAETNMRKGGYEGQLKRDIARMRAAGMSEDDIEAVLGDEIASLGNSPPPRPMDPDVMDRLPDNPLDQ